MEERSYTYILQGHPDVLTLKQMQGAGVWSSQREQKLITDITLESLHDGKPILTGAIHIDVDYHFYIPNPNRSNVKMAKVGDVYIAKPSLFALLNFIEQSASGIIFKDICQVVTLSARKFFNTEPKTVFTIKELHGKQKTVRPERD